MRYERRWLAILLGLFLLPAGCYGPFRLTKAVHEWNGEVGDRWVNEGVFLLFVFFPVYSLATLGDAVIFNSIEFWTGENPIREVEADP